MIKGSTVFVVWLCVVWVFFAMGMFTRNQIHRSEFIARCEAAGGEAIVPGWRDLAKFYCVDPDSIILVEDQ